MRRLRGFILLALLLAAPPSLAQKDRVPTAPPKPQKENAAPVMADGKALFYLHQRVLSLSPEERAKVITDKLDRLMRDPYFRTDAVTTAEGESTTDVVGGDVVILSVTDRDAKAAGRPRQELAATYAASIRAAMEEHARAYSLNGIIKGALFALAATAILVAALILFRSGFPRVYAKIESWRGTRIRSVRIQSTEFLTADRIVSFLVRAAKAVRVLATAVLFYFYVPLVLSFFPWTRGFAGVLLDYVLTPVRQIARAVAAFLPNLFFLVVIVVFTRYVIRFIRLLFDEIERGRIALPGFYPDWAAPTFKIARFLVIAFAAVVAFPYLPGSGSAAFQGVSIFLGVLFSLGSTSAVANVVAGLILTYMRAFKIGDRVRIADTEGDVIGKTLLVTRIRTIKNVDVTVPNSMILGSHITNFTSAGRESGLILHTAVTIGYDAPWRKVHELLASAALSTEDVLREPAPFVLQTRLGDFTVTYELNAHTDQPHRMAQTYSRLHENIQDRFNEAGIEILSPHYTQLRDGNRTTLPKDSLPPDYAPPPFRVSLSVDGGREAGERPGGPAPDGSG